MPVVRVQRILVSTPVVVAGSQFVEGTLTINDPMSIYLSSDLYGSAGTYQLFDYTGGSFVGSITNISIFPPVGRSVDTGISANGCAILGSTITVKLI